MSGLNIFVRGPLRIENERGESIELRGAKEKALLVLLAYSPGHRRSRSWIVDKLWSDRFNDQARTSLRQVLKNVRKALGDQHTEYVLADRSHVQLVCDVTLTDPDEFHGNGELLEDVDVRDPEFEDWIRDLRMADMSGPQLGGRAAVVQDQEPAARELRQVSIGLELEESNTTREEQMVAQTLIDAIAGQLQETGTIQAHVLRGSASKKLASDLEAFIEVQCLSKDGEWFANVRVTPRNRQLYSWSGRLRIPMKFAAIWGGADLTAFANKVQAGVVKTLSQTVPQASFLMLHRATQMLFSGDAKRISDADALLEAIVAQAGSGAALAWRAYGRMTNALEFGDFSPEARMDADQLLQEALEREPSSALVRGLASIVQTKLIGDFDYGHHLADRAMTEDDRNAYALDAFSQALFFRGEHERAHHVSEWARSAAQHTHNAFNWDMRSALSALSLGRVKEARRLALESHLKAPHYRPALRYLLALSALEGDRPAVDRYARLLREQEPGFEPFHMMRKDYPVETLRWLGLQENLPFLR